jgi:cytochrome c oxidase cbb3-type subunit 4
MDYTALRHFADSWGLVFMAATFLALLGWAFRPSARPGQEDARMIPFRDEETEQ